MTMNKIRFLERGEPDLSVEGIWERKKNLRTYMKEKRGETENRDMKERLLVDHFFKALFPETEGACTGRKVFVYLSFSSEAPTDRLIEALLERGCELYCPRIEKGEIYAVRYGEDFSLSDYGIREPIGEIYSGETDIVVLPLLAVDERGNRLGYGKGYYDRYLRDHTRAKRVAYCYDFQVWHDVPITDGDEKADLIVTDKRIIHIEKSLAVR